MKLLYLEDDTTYARQFHSQLLSYRAVRWDLLHCHYLSEALGHLGEDKFDAILCDITNGKKPDVSICDRLVRVVDLPVIAYGSSDNPELARECLAAGAQDYLDKFSVTAPDAMLRIRMAMERLTCYRKHPPELTVRPTESELAELQGAEDPRKNCLSNDDAGNSGDKAAVVLSKDHPSTRAEADADRPRWLIVDDDSWYFDQLRDQYADEIRLDRVSEFEQALGVDPVEYDALILDTSEGNRLGLESLPKLTRRFRTTPVIVVSVHADESTAILAVRSGAEDYLPKSRSSTRELRVAIDFAGTRRGRVAEEYQLRTQVGMNDRRQAARGRDRRMAARYLLTKPVRAIPVLPNGAPDEAGQTDAVSLDLSATGISILVPSRDQLPSRNWVIGIEADDEQTYYASAELRRADQSPEGQRLGLRFLLGNRDILRNENLVPELDSRSYRFETRFAERVLRRWEQLGVINARVCNRLKACPDCQSVVMASCGCRECGSPFLTDTPMIHHFACAYIGHAGDFDFGDQLRCPKCRTSSLVIGADYEQLQGPYSCEECGYEGSEKVTVGNCFSCAIRFPLLQAIDFELVTYDVERLDILAFLDSSR